MSQKKMMVKLTDCVILTLRRIEPGFDPTKSSIFCPPLFVSSLPSSGSIPEEISPSYYCCRDCDDGMVAVKALLNGVDRLFNGATSPPVKDANRNHFRIRFGFEAGCETAPASTAIAGMTGPDMGTGCRIHDLAELTFPLLGRPNSMPSVFSGASVARRVKPTVASFFDEACGISVNPSHPPGLRNSLQSLIIDPHSTALLDVLGHTVKNKTASFTAAPRKNSWKKPWAPPHRWRGKYRRPRQRKPYQNPGRRP